MNRNDGEKLHASVLVTPRKSGDAIANSDARPRTNYTTNNSS